MGIGCFHQRIRYATIYSAYSAKTAAAKVAAHRSIAFTTTAGAVFSKRKIPGCPYAAGDFLFWTRGGGANTCLTVMPFATANFACFIDLLRVDIPRKRAAAGTYLIAVRQVGGHGMGIDRNFAPLVTDDHSVVCSRFRTVCLRMARGFARQVSRSECRCAQQAATQKCAYVFHN